MPVELRQIQIRGAVPGPHLLITGGVHGDEFEPIAAIRGLIHFFQSPQALKQLRGKLTLIPCVNQNAFLRGHRCAEDGLDLARTCPGRLDGSLTEQTAWALSQLIRSADYYIDLHTGGTEFCIHPMSGYVLHSREDVLEKQRVMARAFLLPIVWGTSPELEGRSLSVARDANVPAIYCEYGGAASCSEEGTHAYTEGCLNVMSALGMLDRTQQPEPVQYLIEDQRPNSGHLQVCNPSPVDGFFEPLVQLGQSVAKGTVLGNVIAVADDSLHNIVSCEDGIVLMLRTFPRVRAGESVGVVVQQQL